jgi:hypothetical protein
MANFEASAGIGVSWSADGGGGGMAGDAAAVRMGTMSLDTYAAKYGDAIYADGVSYSFGLTSSVAAQAAMAISSAFGGYSDFSGIGPNGTTMLKEVTILANEGRSAPVLTQSGNPLEQFANSLFGDKVGSIRGNLKGSLNFAIDDKGEYTNYDPTTKTGIAGRTVGNRQGITVYFDPDVIGDFDRLYVFMAHELEHAFNISNGNRSAWSATYGPVLSSALSEIYAYGVGAQAANGLGLPYDFGQQSQHDQLTNQFLEGLYNR